MAAITLLPAVWATSIRAGLGGCDGCLTDHERNLMTAALASLPLLAAAIVLLLTGRRNAGAGATILAQIAVAVGVWLPNKGLSVLMLLLIAGEVAYLVLGARAQRNMESMSAGNGHPSGTRVLVQDE
jgi:membrane protein implicated in regulation of membrane protease activity